MIIPGSTLYITSLWLIKSSMVIFYKRLADRTRYQIVYNITLGTLAATWLVLFFDVVFKCYPPRRQWEGLSNPERENHVYLPIVMGAQANTLTSSRMSPRAVHNQLLAYYLMYGRNPS